MQAGVRTAEHQLRDIVKLVVLTTFSKRADGLEHGFEVVVTLDLLAEVLFRELSLRVHGTCPDTNSSRPPSSTTWLQDFGS
jgi:hypothetical protein